MFGKRNKVLIVLSPNQRQNVKNFLGKDANKLVITKEIAANAMYAAKPGVAETSLIQLTTAQQELIKTKLNLTLECDEIAISKNMKFK